MAFQERPLLDQQVFVQDIAEHVRRFGQRYRARLNLAGHITMDANVVSGNLAIDLGGFADNENIRVDIAINLAIDLDLALTDEIAGNFKIGAEKRRWCRRLWRRRCRGDLFSAFGKNSGQT